VVSHDDVSSEDERAMANRLRSFVRALLHGWQLSRGGGPHAVVAAHAGSRRNSNESGTDDELESRPGEAPLRSCQPRLDLRRAVMRDTARLSEAHEVTARPRTGGTAGSPEETPAT